MRKSLERRLLLAILGSIALAFAAIIIPLAIISEIKDIIIKRYKKVRP